MSLSQRSRSAIYTGLKDLVEEEAVEEMLSNFPVRDLDEPVTQGFVRAEVADVRAEIADVRAEMADVRTEIADVRAEIAVVRTEVAELRADMHRGFQRLMLVNITTMIGFAAVLVAAFSAT